MAFSFLSGIIVCSILIFGVRSVLPIRAETDNLSGQSENLTQSLIDLIPDIEKIYRESLTMPFQKAANKIYDDDIAEFYQELLERSVLSEPENQTD